MDLVDLGWDDAWQAVADAHPAVLAGGVPARVARVEAAHARLLTADGEVTVPVPGLVVGDWVLTDAATWAQPLQRRTVLSRQSSGRDSAEQPLAANVDVVVVAEPVVPEANVRRVERMLTLAWASGAQPLVLLTKTDLAADGGVQAATRLRAAAPGVDVVPVSAATGSGVDDLRSHLVPGRTFVLLGPSGAGKSTVVNALAGHEALATADVRGDGRGRHTTTHRELVVVPGAGLLIDTPGIRTVGMTADEDGLDRVFEDVVALTEKCRYADCGHVVEPGCAVQGAVQSGELDPARLASYLRLQREIEHQARRKATRDRSEERRVAAGRKKALAVAMRAKGR